MVWVTRLLIRLVEEKLIATVADLYSLELKALSGLERLAEKVSMQLISCVRG